jgi:hypothetical protein
VTNDDRKPRGSRERTKAQNPKPASKKRKIAAARPESVPDSTNNRPVGAPDPVFEAAFASSQKDQGLVGMSLLADWHRSKMWRQRLGTIAGWLSSRGDGRFDRVVDAVRALTGWHNNPMATESLCELLADPDDEVRTEAFGVMARIGSAGGARLTEVFWPYILRGREDPLPKVRLLAVHSLRWFASLANPVLAAAFESTLGALHDTDASVRYAAIRALGAFELERVLAVFETVVKLAENQDPSVRRSVCELLGGLGVDALSAVLPLVTVVARDTDDEVRKAGAMALFQIDAKAKFVDLGPDDIEFRSKFIQGLLVVGEPARSFRRSLETRWRREMVPPHSRQTKTAPPELADIWELFSPEEQECLLMMWLHRRVDGLPKKNFFQFLGMGALSERNNNTFRSRRSAIRGKLRKAKRGVPFECDRTGRLYWLPPSGR